ncbi:MAG: bifunctional folylpolyglutamate synthase/dihydrofolate synthase [Chlorobiaceae bacterium]|nr:bifunctional folylpolyglutamate synthase/dihydrofolate synthase [Chlorobiaceae bacterium]
MDYQESIDFLFPLHRFGIKPGLDRIERLLDVLGHPEHSLGTIVHIAGTNGKGTVASCMASIFRASGRKTALFTSPHLVDFTERIRIDGKRISESMVAAYCTKLRPAVLELGATFFETTTAMAFAFFAEEGVEASVIETGMGGRLDATNVVKAEMVIIPSIGLDHTAWLGATLREIAAEKAAIIKQGSRVYTAVNEEESLDAIREAAARQGALLHRSCDEAHCEVIAVQPGLLDFRIALCDGEWHRFSVPLSGSYHAANVALAVMASRSEGISWQHIGAGLSEIRSTGYRARLECIGTQPLVMLDVSHNPEGMQRTVQALVEMRGFFRSLYVLLGVAADKDAAGIARQISSIAAEVVAVNLSSERSLPSGELGQLCVQAGIRRVSCFDSAEEGLDLLFTHAGAEDMILVTGSFYLAGEVAAMHRFSPPESSSSR